MKFDMQCPTRFRTPHRLGNMRYCGFGGSGFRLGEELLEKDHMTPLSTLLFWVSQHTDPPTWILRTSWSYVHALFMSLYTRASRSQNLFRTRPGTLSLAGLRLQITQNLCKWQMITTVKWLLCYTSRCLPWGGACRSVTLGNGWRRHCNARGFKFAQTDTRRSGN